jgi:hypothetical protein
MAAGPYLLVYDPEDRPSRALADWAGRKDRHGLVTAFPCQNGELVTVAPELAGLPLHRVIHGLDVASREVHQGPELLPHLLLRLPGWRLLAPAARWPWFAARLLRRLG